MQYIKLYENFGHKKYTNLIVVPDDTAYQVPFDLYYEKSFDHTEMCFGDPNNKDQMVLCFPTGLYYDDIASDADISKFVNTDLSDIKLEKGWDKYVDNGFPLAKANPEYHVKRIAKLVQEMKKNVPINPVHMCFDDQAYSWDIPAYIQDGNHRLRALKYLKYDYFPAYIYGSHDKYLIDYIKTNQ